MQLFAAMDGCNSYVCIIIFSGQFKKLNLIINTVLILITLGSKQKYAVNAPVNIDGIYIKKQFNIFEKICYTSLLNVKLTTTLFLNKECY